MLLPQRPRKVLLPGLSQNLFEDLAHNRQGTGTPASIFLREAKIIGNTTGKLRGCFSYPLCCTHKPPSSESHHKQMFFVGRRDPHISDKNPHDSNWEHQDFNFRQVCFFSKLMNWIPKLSGNSQHSQFQKHKKKQPPISLFHRFLLEHF